MTENSTAADRTRDVDKLTKPASASNATNPLPVRVAFFTGYIPPYALPVFEEIAARVQELKVFISTPMEGNRTWDSDFGNLSVEVQNTRTFLSRWKHRVGFSDTSETHLPLDTIKQLRKFQPDIIVSEELGFRSLLCSAYQLFRPDIPLVLVCNLSEHTEQGRGPLRNLVRKWFARRATVTTANGTSGMRYLASIGFRSNSLHHFPYVAVPGVFESISLTREPSQSHDLLYVGEITQRKGVHLILTALSDWLEQRSGYEVRMKLAGIGDQFETLSNLQWNSRLHLEWLGQQNYHEVAEQMSKSGIFVFPTLADEWGLVVNEALAAGLPVLGSPFSQAVLDLIEPGQNGWVFDPTSRDDFHSALDQAFAKTPSELEQIRMNCRASVADRTPAWAAEKFINALQAAREVTT